jgi:hypothetical protein
MTAWPLLILDVISVLLFKLWRVKARGTGYLNVPTKTDKTHTLAIPAADMEAPLLDDIEEEEEDERRSMGSSIDKNGSGRF